MSFDQSLYTVDEGNGSITLFVWSNVAGGPVNGSVVFFTEDGSATCK